MCLKTFETYLFQNNFEICLRPNRTTNGKGRDLDGILLEKKRILQKPNLLRGKGACGKETRRTLPRPTRSAGPRAARGRILGRILVTLWLPFGTLLLPFRHPFAHFYSPWGSIFSLLASAGVVFGPSFPVFSMKICRANGPKACYVFVSQSLLFFPCISLIIGRRPGGIDSWSLVCDESRIFLLGGDPGAPRLDLARFSIPPNRHRKIDVFSNPSKTSQKGE